MKRFRRPSEFPERPIYLKQWRKHCQVTLDQIAARCGLSKASLSRIERRLTPYYADVLEIYAAYLGIEIYDLFSMPDSGRREFDMWFCSLSEAQRRKALRVLKEAFAPEDDALLVEGMEPGSKQLDGALV